MKQYGLMLFMTFVYKPVEAGTEMQSRGCREIIRSRESCPGCVKGFIELDGENVPVLDLGQCLGGQAIELDGSVCILVVELEHCDKLVRTGVLIKDLDEIMVLAAGRLGDNYEELSLSGRLIGRMYREKKIRRVLSENYSLYRAGRLHNKSEDLAMLFNS